VIRALAVFECDNPVHTRSCSGPSWVNGKPVGLEEALALLVDASSPLYDSPLGYLSRLRNYVCQHFNLEQHAIYTEVRCKCGVSGAARVAGTG